MVQRALTFLLVAAAAVLAQVSPRDAAAAYPVHVTTEVGDVGARIVPADVLKNATDADLAACCVVVEVAVYPKVKAWVGPDRFQLHVGYPGKKGGSDIKAATPEFVASMLQQIAQHSFAREQTVTLSGSPGHAATQSVGPDASMNPGATEHDRYVAAEQLSNWVLSDGAATQPTAGWLYFPARLKDGAVLSLTVLLNGTRVPLPLQP